MIFQKAKIKLKQPVLLCSWPGIGLVGNYVLNYLISQLKPTIFAEIDLEEYVVHHNVVVEDNNIFFPQPRQNLFYRYNNDIQDILFFVCDMQPLPHLMYKLSKEIVSFALSLKVSLIITFAGMPSNILHTEKPKIYIIKTSPGIKFPATEEKHPLHYSIIEGMNGVILGVAKECKLPGVGILSEIPVYAIDIENPQSALRIISLLDKMFSLKIKYDKIYTDIDFISKKIKNIFDNLSQKAHKLMSQIEPDGEEGFIPPGISFEELKKQLKFSLPASAKNRIEELFNLCEKDLKYASELKKELDKWDVYKEYEDKFLKLFLKNKGETEE